MFYKERRTFSTCLSCYEDLLLVCFIVRSRITQNHLKFVMLIPSPIHIHHYLLLGMRLPNYSNMQGLVIELFTC
jgi:hypothetical protein